MPTFQRITIRADIDPAEAVTFCDDQNWTLLDLHSEGVEFMEHVFQASPNTIVHVMEDNTIRKNFFSIHGPECDSIARHILSINNNVFYPLKVNTREESIELAKRLKDPLDIYYAVLSSSDDFDEEVFRCYQKAFEHPDSDVRFYACTSMGYFVGWDHHFVPLVKQLADHDPDLEIRQIAAQSLETMARHDWNRASS